MAIAQQEAQAKSPATGTAAAKVGHKREVLVIPVSDVDHAKNFYANLGWRLDADYDSGSDFRVIQFPPTGSACSVIFGKNVTAAAPGSAQRIGQADPNWPDWYAEYMVREQSGEELPK
jgi:catechol 2,3-dioxygenase-like lactoylglutathione lyase family enzyme